MSSVAIVLRGAEKRFGATRAVHATTIAVERGELFAVLGPSGCGKTTLLRLIAGFERPDSGTVEVGGEAVAGNGCWISPERRRIGMVFQDYALFPHLRVADNVAFGLRRGWRRRGALEPGARNALELVGLQHKADRYPHELSGGERQRVALARALVTRPRCVLADEPTGNLDRKTAGVVFDLMLELNRDIGTSLVIVTHDPELAARAGRTLHLVDGVLSPA